MDFLPIHPRGIGGWCTDILFQEFISHYLLSFPTRDKHSASAVDGMNWLYQEAPLLTAFSNGQPVCLLRIRTNNDSAWTNNHSVIDLDNALVRA
jgi:hypothetical protein